MKMANRLFVGFSGSKEDGGEEIKGWGGEHGSRGDGGRGKVGVEKGGILEL